MFKIILLMLALFCACNDAEKPVAEKLKVVVTNFPVYWLTEFIAGNTVEVIYSVPADIDPAYWLPEDQDIARMQQADLILLSGASYEKWLNTVELPKNKLVDTSLDCQQMFLKVEDMVKHEHNGKVHSHDGYDFNIWLDMSILFRQAEAVASSLGGLIPVHQKLYRQRLRILKSKFNNISIKFNSIVGNQQKFLTSHPVYNYLAKSCNWQLQNFHWEPDEMPGPSEWDRLQKATRFSRFMLFEDQPSAEIESRLNDYGVRVIVFRPCGKRPSSNDFMEEMKENLKNLEEALRP